GATDRQPAHAGDLWIQPELCEHHPRAEYAAIVISGQSSRRVRIQLGKDAMHDALRLPGGAGEVVHPRSLERDLIPHEREFAAGPSVELLEMPVQTADRGGGSADRIEECPLVEPHHETVLARAAFDEPVPDTTVWAKGRSEPAVWCARYNVA